VTPHSYHAVSMFWYIFQKMLLDVNSGYRTILQMPHFAPTVFTDQAGKLIYWHLHLFEI